MILRKGKVFKNNRDSRYSDIAIPDIVILRLRGKCCYNKWIEKKRKAKERETWLALLTFLSHLAPNLREEYVILDSLMLQ